MEEKIKAKIIGQDKTIEKIINFLKRAEIGLNEQHRPIASFLFVGPSGVGKTELAKTLAEVYFPEQQGSSNFIKIDMSEFGEKFQATKLIGAPAGYVGYKEGNNLADKIKNRPHSVILLDEIDKAHPDIFNLFLQILDEGKLTDATGKKINFKNTIIIMTANLEDNLFKLDDIGFGLQASSNTTLISKQDIKEELLKKFRTDFINRIDQILIFNHLTNSDLEKIIKNQIDNLNKKIISQAQLKISPEVISFLIQKTITEQQGARGIDKIISENIEETLINLLLINNQKNKKDELFLFLENEKIKIKYD